MLKVLYAASEARPFIASGGLADVAGSLPGALCDAGVDCRVILPLYSDIPGDWKAKMEFITCFTVNLAWRRLYCGVFQAKVGKVTYYFVDNEYYFKRGGIYGFYDDAERFAYFSKAILDVIGAVGFKPDVINCNDWQTALVPVYYHLYYRWYEGYDNIKTVFTIHNIQYQGKYGTELLDNVLGISQADSRILEYDNCVNFMKGAIQTADRVTTVSPTYAQEILDPWYSYGMDRILKQEQWKLSGILNGIDTVLYNPAADPVIYAKFDAKHLEKKEENKKKLLESLGLPYEPEKPLIGMVTRLTGHKGVDLVQYIFDIMMERRDIQMVILGSGEAGYENFFRQMQARYPQNVCAIIGFFADRAKQIYAGCDMFLMPSQSEPCGLAQMVALRYGTIPIVRATGGLKDSIIDYGEENGNGFTFKTYNAHDMNGAIERAKGLYYGEKGLWKDLVVHAMGCDFSWKASAQKYLDVYQSVL